MCGRYALALRPSQIRRLLEDDDMSVDDSPADEGDDAPRQSYNFAPGYYGVVYRADVPDRGAGTGTTSATHHPHGGADAATDDAARTSPSTEKSKPQTQPRYKLQSMKWGLVPFWTKRNPGYPSLLKTINCRDDSLASPGGMWASMKARKRCVVVAQGFFEWLSRPGGGPKDKVPHFIKRKDGRLMLFAGLWDCVRYEGDEDRGHYTYTIVTTDSNKQLKFLHDRMPVILEPGSEALWTWLDPGRCEWNRELQALLRPFEGELEVYPVSKEVGKVGNNSPNFVIPVASRENKANIANFFAKGAEKGKKAKTEIEVEVKKENQDGEETETKKLEELEKSADDGGMGTPRKGTKREADLSPREGEPSPKKGLFAKSASPAKGKPQTRAKISATSNAPRSPAKVKGKADGSQKITKFFGNNA
ncbi:embryonic stem cell-specific 5-hydroxymethylcytosine-binding protein [Corynascus novoguineensis]|uniref:Embryonic stem cell-specific 5-hydroxymethylcytosine-binding protein n=1 Tax=Corynascus novoguineensis TaxID=1126955 RepID=A0AAN7HST9_9PEZI|nr:embryonic stem cell-specific 5-hydroxymethylcytosine-binding protein [Corynascus novoguineensis]